MKIHAIITARGGSKGLPRKNILPLAGKPLIVYSILAAKECNKISRCIVSTEDLEISDIAKIWGAEVFNRPVELASDSALSQEVVQNVLESLTSQNDYPEYFVLLQPTSPLRTSQHLNESIELLLASCANSLVSVTEEEHHPYKSFTLPDKYLKPLFGNEYLDKPRQQLPKIYRQNGAIYIVKSSEFQKKRRFAIDPVIPYLMKLEESVDIDSANDLLSAEKILAEKE